MEKVTVKKVSATIFAKVSATPHCPMNMVADTFFVGAH
jgi:hypothetical protein